MLGGLQSSGRDIFDPRDFNGSEGTNKGTSNIGDRGTEEGTQQGTALGPAIHPNTQKAKVPLTTHPHEWAEPHTLQKHNLH